MLHGFDVSAYQGNIVPTADFVIVKATEGASYSSSRFAAQWKSAATRAKVRGAYHFARPEESSYKDQADRFLDAVQPSPGEPMWLDLEASKLSQSATNVWARNWGDHIANELGEQQDVYLGRGYATNGTGRDLAKHFRHWWYPQYPSSARTSKWRTTFDPWLPSGLTCGWTKPHVWQWTDNFNGLDANITDLTLDQLATGGPATPMEEDMPYGGRLAPSAKENISFPRGSEGAIGLVYDSPDKAKVRIAFHHKSGGGEVSTVEVGGPASATDSWPQKAVVKFKNKADGDWVSLTRLDEGKDPVGWDMS